MHKITDETLKLRGALDTTYGKGVGIFTRGEIQNIRRSDDFRRFQGKVQGSRIYDVEATFDPQGNIEGTGCTCPAYQSYYGDCKHITALLMAIGKYRDPRDNQENHIKSLIASYRQESPEAKRILHLQPALKISRGIGELELRLGEEKTYVVKNLGAFIQSYNEERPLVFGKNFTYDPEVQAFTQEDRRVMAYLSLLWDMDRRQENLGAQGSPEKMFRGRTLKLKDHGLEELLQRWMSEGKGRDLWIEGVHYSRVRLREGKIPVNFRLKQRARGGMSLMRKEEAPMISLDTRGNLVFYQGGIYKMRARENQKIRPLLRELIFRGDMEIPESQEAPFITEVLPAIEEHGDCAVAPSLKERIRKEPLKARLYLDQEPGKVIAKLEFFYGDRRVNPFDREEPREHKKNGLGAGEILIRDKAGENQLLTLLEEGDFTVHRGRCYMEKEENIFFFLDTLLPKLRRQRQLSVYYSDDFKEIKTLGPGDLTGRITLNHDVDLLECRLDMENIPTEELAELLKSIEKKAKYHRLADGRFLSLRKNGGEKLSTWLQAMELDPGDMEEGVVKIPKYKAFEMEALLKEQGDSPFRRDRNLEDFLENFRKLAGEDALQNQESVSLPRGLHGELREYQKKGFRWLSTLSEYGFGGILADEMGLGKTLQTLAYLEKEREKGIENPSILVVPTSLVYNWKEEIQRFAPELTPLIISGSKEERREKIRRAAEYDLVITSYPLLRRDREEYRDRFFHACILDEGQHIKNKGSQSAKAVKSLRGNHRFVLTGTPLENNLSELWSIFDFVIPGYLGSYQGFVEKYVKSKDTPEGSCQLKKLRRRVQPFILRRMKTDVLRELPEKSEGKLLVDMTEEQQKLYRVYVEKIKEEIEEGEEEGMNSRRIQILAGLTRLRQISCHPGVFMEDYRGGSGKLQALGDILNRGMEGGHRFLVFSQFTELLKMVREDLKSRGHASLYLDGSLPMSRRGDLVKAFNRGEAPIFLISLKAGGTGLNLTAADQVIHLDPWWNPAVENQATDRAHRMGQDKKVQVRKLIARGTIEEKIHEIQQRKRALIDGVIQREEGMFSGLTKDELLALLEG